MHPTKRLVHVTILGLVVVVLTCSPTVWSQPNLGPIGSCSVPKYMKSMTELPSYQPAKLGSEGRILCGASMATWNAHGCCPESAITTLTQAYNDLLDEKEDDLLDFGINIQTGASNILDLYDRMDPSDKMKLQEVADEIDKDVESLLHALAYDFTKTSKKCLSRVLRYLVGALCIGCDLNWPNYLIPNGINPKSGYTFKLSTGTCDMIADGCNDLMNMVAAFYKMLSVIEGSEEPLAHCETEAECRVYLCDNLVSGGSIHFDAIFSIPESTKRSSQSKAAKLAAAYKEGMPRNSKEYFVKRLLDFADQLQDTAATSMFVSSTKRSDRPSNTYVAAGFQADIVGNETQVDTREVVEPPPTEPRPAMGPFSYHEAPRAAPEAPPEESDRRTSGSGDVFPELVSVMTIVMVISVLLFA